MIVVEHQGAMVTLVEIMGIGVNEHRVTRHDLASVDRLLQADSEEICMKWT